MNMYVDILSGSLDWWISDVSDDALLDYVLAARAAFAAPGTGTSAHASLTAQIAYDRALMHLAATRGIEVSPRNFCNAPMERLRLEAALAEHGVNLVELARRIRRGPEAPTPSP